MARSMISEAASPFALIDTLPDVFRHRDMQIRFLTQAVDELLAPVWLSLDNYEEYLDPAIAPLDFVEMTAAWLGLPYDHNWNEAQARRLVAAASEIFQWRGTVRGLRALVSAYCEDDPERPASIEVSESGGAIVDTTHDADSPGDDRPNVLVTVEIPGDANVDPTRLTALIASYVPAHVAVHVEIGRGRN